MIVAELLDACSAERLKMPWSPPGWLERTAVNVAEFVLSRDDEALMLLTAGDSSSALSEFINARVTYSEKVPAGWALLVSR